MARIHRFFLPIFIVSICISAFSAEQKDLIRVTMKKGSKVFYGPGTLVGTRSPASTDQKLVLLIPGAGEIQIPQAAIEKIEPVKEGEGPVRIEPAVLDSKVIKTTHLVLLANGEKIVGNVLPGPETEPLQLEIPGLGRTLIARNRVSKVEEKAGEIKLPEPAEEPPQPPAPPAESEKPAAEEKVPPRIDPELKAEILESIYDLTRWRSRDRVRAENRLRLIGSPAIQYLERIARDPFELTRRAVQRILRDVADPAGIPLAIEGLLDDDDYVRETAAEALRKITGKDLGYRPYGSIRSRTDAYRRWIAWWEENSQQ